MRFTQFYNLPIDTRYVFLNVGSRPGRGGTNVRDDADDYETREDWRSAEARRRERDSLVSRAAVSQDLKQRMRQFLAGGDIERANIIDQFLSREITRERSADLEKLMDSMDREDGQWSNIFAVQRKIRGDIQKLQWRTESYMERMPHRKDIFQTSLKEIKTLNRRDDSVDRDLKRILFGLTQIDPTTNAPGALEADHAREIYNLDPRTMGYERILNRYEGVIAHNDAGRQVFRQLKALKQEEAMIERQFKRIDRSVDRMIAQNLSKVRRRATKEKLLKQFGSAIGITLKEGIEIEALAPEAIQPPERGAHFTISAIKWKERPVYDSRGKLLYIDPGLPQIFLSDGSGGSVPYTISRLKKWVDAVDAVEKINGLDAIEEVLGLKKYGIKVTKGMMVSYLRRERRRDGSIESKPVYATITDVHDGHVYFDEPVQFQPGLENIDEYEMRTSLSLGEFVKWWRRYEVEKAVSQVELREMLKKYNESENKEYGIPEDQNPPILVERGEELRYPDDSDTSFLINKVDMSGVSLNNGRYMTFPEFFNWVKTNQIEKVPKREETPAEKKRYEEKMRDVEEQMDDDSVRKFLKDDKAVEKLVNVRKHAAEVAADSPIKRIAKFWHQTEFVSLADIWNLTKEMVEFVKRRHERRSKGRYASMLSKMPGLLGTEGERVKEAAEQEEVGKYKEPMEHWSILKLKKELYMTNNKDVAKAAITTLVHKGEMRWDEPPLWKVLNRLTSRYTLKGAQLYIPEPQFMPPFKSGEDMSLKSCDALWGDGTGAEWFLENTNKYNSNVQNFQYKFKQLENDPKGTGGPPGELERMLKDWRQGKYVNPQDYEAMIHGAINFGKMSAEEKVYYIFAGVLSREGDDPLHGHHNPHGETLLSMDRIGEMDSKYLNQFPLLDFFTQEYVEDPYLWDKDKGRFGKARKLNLGDLREMMEKYFKQDFLEGKPGASFSRFLWEVMLMKDSVRTRISKGLRNAENMDHDDAHLYIPPASIAEIDRLTQPITGSKLPFTTPAYMNAYAGFGQFFASLTNAIDEQTTSEGRSAKILSLRDGLNSFIHYDLIMDGRMYKDDKNRARLDEHHYNSGSVVDGLKPVKFHQMQLRGLMEEVGEAYSKDFSFLYGRRTGSTLDPKEKEKQQDYERRVQELKEIVNDMVDQDGGEKLIAAMKKRMSKSPESAQGLRALPKSRRPKPAVISEMRHQALHDFEHRMEGGEH